ncbi:RRXRR domain-containing protein [Deinococcus hopiensis]|uniref:RRXRR domain-containing protein n=1 Tax=Deinococcus hopiensis TaxID=309885 RepID=UPI003CCBF400
MRSNRVFVLNPDRTPLMPCTAKRARKMPEAGRAAMLPVHHHSQGRVRSPVSSSSL